MYSNVGKKIQTLAKVIAWIGIIFSLLLGGLELYGGINTYDYNMIINAIVIMIFGPLLSWISAITLYGFGNLVESNSQMKDEIIEIKNKIN